MSAQEMLISFSPMLFIFAIFYFLTIRPQKRQEREIASMRNSIKEGDEVVTIGGIIGKVVKVKDDEISIEAGSDRTRFNMKIWAIREKKNIDKK